MSSRNPTDPTLTSSVLLPSAAIMTHHHVLKLLLIWICIAVFVKGSLGAPCDLTRWNGVWNQVGGTQVKINGNNVTTKGHCIRSEGEKYLFVDSEHTRQFYHCIFIVEKHKNVLQYKESVTRKKESMDACSGITYGAVILLRADADKVACPFKGAFTFTYNRGYGKCTTPVSKANSCAEVGKMQLDFSACPDVRDSDHAIVDVLCFATWTDGSSRFMFGVMLRYGVQSINLSFRCFVYDEVKPKEFQVAVSEYETCSSVMSPTQGAMTMTLKKVEQYDECHFPTWMTLNSPWHFKDDNNTIFYFSDNSTIHFYDKSSKIVTRQFICDRVSEITKNVAAYVTHNIQLCKTNFVCLLFERLPDQTVVWQSGENTSRKDDACEKYFSRNRASKRTLVGSYPEPTDCSPSLSEDSTFLETDETKGLSTQQLQRLVLLEQRKVLRMQKKALCEEDPPRNN